MEAPKPKALPKDATIHENVVETSATSMETSAYLNWRPSVKVRMAEVFDRLLLAQYKRRIAAWKASQRLQVDSGWCSDMDDYGQLSGSILLLTRIPT